ncbi:non-specific serine/threonine protein kinase [Ranunculus cassubicifolius]
MQLGRVALLVFFIFSFLPSQYVAQIFNITPSHPLAVGQILVSPGQIFELGFFSTNISANRYLGLWHKNIFPRKYVWVANRDNPLAATDTLATLRIGSKSGSLELVDGNQTSVWTTNISNSSSALLLDTGKFVVKNVAGAVIWDIFNNPSDTILPNMFMGSSRNFLRSWKSRDDPSPGLFLARLSTELPTQAFIWSNGSTTHWRSGPWDTSKFIGLSVFGDRLDVNPFHLADNVSQGSRNFYFNFDNIPGDRIVSYMDLTSEGRLGFSYSESGQIWTRTWESWENPCDNYGACGSFGVCTASENPICKCLTGFIPKSNEEWSNGNWTGGCVRRTNLSCGTNSNESVSSNGTDGFIKAQRVKVPDFHKFATTLKPDKFDDCKTQCLNNCSCLAFAYVDNIGCLFWFKDLIDIQQFASFGEDLYIRLAHSELGGGKSIKLISSLAVVGCSSIFLAIIAFILHRRRANKKRQAALAARRIKSTSMIKSHRDGLREYIGKHDPSELKIYDFECILTATDNFNITNKLGQGGFGPVYKGMLPDGKEVAVKRLSSSSKQGVNEFKNEMLLISNLQHKNLVRMMGCCVKEDEKLLIYEFMHNKSLDNFLYDPEKKAVLTWATRFNIIQGIARGLLYLHHDSYVKVIHRDLKVSNILLDEKMNPKISDFGLARIVEETQSIENTQKVVGTRGYMSPEYAMGGIFSEKSDVYSFGVLLLEIISGKKNISFFLYEQQLGFVGYAWNLWNEGRAVELVDAILDDLYSSSGVMTCMHVALLCVQDNATDRPTMVDVASMLNREKDGPNPKKPVFTMQNSVYHPHLYSENSNSSSSKNEASITMIEGR